LHVVFITYWLLVVPLRKELVGLWGENQTWYLPGAGGLRVSLEPANWKTAHSLYCLMFSKEEKL
jgi:hypothetical protein